MSALGLGVLGCGDFLRWQRPAIDQAADVRIAALFDPRSEAAEAAAAWSGGSVRASAQAVIDDPAVEVVCIFVPPWLRPELVEAAAAAGKAVLTTKPLAADEEGCQRIATAVNDAGIACGVIYNRTDNGFVHTARRVLADGGLGRMALYKQDWLHHYPQWNTWALDPDKNGGPFMDAMIHNLNAARFLADAPMARGTLFADRHSQNIPCADTEFVKLDFSSGASAHLFITWAAALEVTSTAGNYREHIDQLFLVTDQGWMLRPAGGRLEATRHGEIRSWPMHGPATSHYQRFVEHLRDQAPWPEELASVAESAADIRLLRRLESQHREVVALDDL